MSLRRLSFGPKPSRRPKDPRYNTGRWRRLSDEMLGKPARNKWPGGRSHRSSTVFCAWPSGCHRLAQALDHIVPVIPFVTSDREFFGRHNLRPLCHHHNVGRAMVGSDDPEPPPGPRRLPRIG
jgi:hypothetical protein